MKSSIFTSADILLPREHFEQWSVIACDQFTSNSEYWESVDDTIGAVPSTRHLIYPEVYLGKTDAAKVTDDINRTMQEYLDNGIYQSYPDALIYVERTQSDGKLRLGLIGAVDLDEYDYNEGSASKIRATEKTVLERIPPRVEIRKNAPTELPHILMLMDDRKGEIIEPLQRMAADGKMKLLYDFDLMLGGGHLRGYLVPNEYNEAICQKVAALGDLHGGITLAVGDGNHSLATAKACRELGRTEQNRYALCELINIHSEALEFEPIYRTVENIDSERLLREFCNYLDKCEKAKNSNTPQDIVFVTDEQRIPLHIENPPHALAVGTVQSFLYEILPNYPDAVIDYIHGEDEVQAVVSKGRACGFLYNCMGKSELFDAVEREGVLPRKTFSMGHAKDKRYYTEVRKIK